MTLPLVQIAPGYSVTDPNAVWTDITTAVDVNSVGLSIGRGASDEISQIQPGTLSLTLDNSDGRFSPPAIRKGTPIRAQVATLDSPTGTAPYPLAQLADSFDDNRVNTALWPGNSGGATEVNGLARVPAAAGVTAAYASARQYTFTGSWSTVHLVTVPSPTGATTATATFMVNAVTSATRAGFLVNSVAGTISCRSETGFTDASAVTLTYSPTSHAWLRIRESAGSVIWETSPDGYTWTVRRTAATPAWVGADQVLLSLTATRNAGATDFAEFDLVGAMVHPRFYGSVTNPPLGWKGLLSTIPITASDEFAWLSRQPALQPMLVQEVLLDGPQAYYPLSEPDGSTSGGDLSGNTRPSLAAVQIGVGGNVQFGQGTGPPSDGLSTPSFTPASASAGKYLTTDLNTRLTTESNPGSYLFESWFSTTTAGRVLMSWATSDPPSFENSITFLLDSSTGHLQIEKRSGGFLTTTTVATPSLADGNTHYLLFDEASATLYVDATSYAVSIGPSIELRLLTVGAYNGGRLWSGNISHVAIYVNTGSGPTAAAVADHNTAGTTGYSGQAADQRLARLAGYAGITSVIPVGAFSPVGSQGELGATALSHMQDVEKAESGKLLCDRGSPALVFQGRTVRYNPVSALTIAYADTESDDSAFADDDQKLVNMITGSRPGGATQRVVNRPSVALYGTYEKQLDLIKVSDNEVLDAANWTVLRYADPPPEMRQLPVEAYSMGTAVYRALLAADISTVFAVTGLPATAPTPTTTVTAEGYTETIRQGYHLLDFHTSRATTDAVWTLDDPVYSVLGSTTRLAY